MKLLPNIFKGASLATALFIFQACYGPAPYNRYLEETGEAPMSFTVTSRATGEPLAGIRVLGAQYSMSGADTYYEELGLTGKDGRCNVVIPYIRNMEGPLLRFEDPEEVYSVKDTVLNDLTQRDIAIKL